MVDKLKTLIDAARSVRMTDMQKEEQRRSFAYGNTKIENKRITRETVDRQAKALQSENDQ